MIETKPDFYDKFICIADRCSDSCCIGWEIDIDEGTMQKYQNESGNLSVKLQTVTDKVDSCFILDSDERCPFLNKDNLCELILKKGDDFLCDICREHPRFYEWYGNYTDMGLGLCCEEASRLLFDSMAPLEFTENKTDDESDCPAANENYRSVREVRANAINIIQNRNKPLYERIKGLLIYANQVQHGDDEIEIKSEDEYFDSVLSAAEKTEPYDKDFTLLLNKLKEKKEDILLSQNAFYDYLGERRAEYEKLLCYLLFRWLIKALYDGNFEGKINFCLGVTAITYYTDILCFLKNGKFLPRDRINNVKYISKQFEYSDINPEAFGNNLSAVKK